VPLLLSVRGRGAAVEPLPPLPPLFTEEPPELDGWRTVVVRVVVRVGARGDAYEGSPLPGRVGFGR